MALVAGLATCNDDQAKPGTDALSQLSSAVQSAEVCWNLSQGPKNNDLGDVCISNDGDWIYVEYTTDGACLLTQVHVCAALSDFPWTPPGQCAYNAEFDQNPASSYTVTIPLSDFPGAVCGESTFFIQAHAALDCGGAQESAYAGAFKGNVEYVLQCVPEDEGCTLTQGYWKNHESDWSSVDLGLGGVTYSHAEALAVLNTPVKGDASLILAHQLIAAKLNIEVGGASDGAVSDAIADADAWLAANADADGSLPFGVKAGSAAGAEAVALSAVLDDYNNGLIGPGHCE
ncbi:MAG: hypothetical protein HUU21_10755 [Polyangiaceae bacterium]|nr:hypothetical protein [Polyangiaceae bacterium]